MDSRLTLKASKKGSSTILEDVYCEAPYRIMRPFPKGERTEVIIMSASAGLFGGDSAVWQIDVGCGAGLCVYTQSYEKIFCKNGRDAVRDLSVNIGEGASLLYLPQPAIPFAGSRYLGNTVINMAESSSLVYGEILSCGRVAMGESFNMELFRSRTRIFVDGAPVFADHTLLKPGEWEYGQLGMWERFTHSGLLYIRIRKNDGAFNEISDMASNQAYTYNGSSGRIFNETADSADKTLDKTPDKASDKFFMEKIRSLCDGADDTMYIGSSLTRDGIAVRALGMQGEKIYGLFKRIADSCG